MFELSIFHSLKVMVALWLYPERSLYNIEEIVERVVHS